MLQPLSVLTHNVLPNDHSWAKSYPTIDRVIRGILVGSIYPSCGSIDVALRLIISSLTASSCQL